VDVEKLLVIAVIAGLCLGPARLAAHTKQLTNFLRQLRGWADTTKAQIAEQTGVDIDWSELDPRRYDPRRIIRDALTQPPTPHEPAVESTVLTHTAEPTNSRTGVNDDV
jgi:sec-independent protein translocase protein TatB